MRNKAPRDYGNTPIEVGIYANVHENQAGKITFWGIFIGLVGWFSSYFFKVIQTHRYNVSFPPLMPSPTFQGQQSVFKIFLQMVYVCADI